MTKLQLSMFNLIKSRIHLLEPADQAYIERLSTRTTKPLNTAEISRLNSLNTQVQ